MALVRILLLATLLIAPLMFAGCTSAPDEGDDGIAQAAVDGTPGPVGGTVTNSPPTVPTFTGGPSEGINSGSFTVTFTGVARDTNTESDLTNLAVSATGPNPITPPSHTVTLLDTTAPTEPLVFGADNFKVWTTTADDGLLNFRFQYTFPAGWAPGVYNFRATATDASGATGQSGTVAITLVPLGGVTIQSTPVAADGSPLTGQNWGMWNAQAGAANVASTNYAKLINSGNNPTSRVVIDFDAAFVGATDPRFTIPVASNVQFAWWEDTTPLTSAPNEGTYNFGTANPDGTMTLTFSGTTNIIYVTYRIVQLPSILTKQSYGVAYTVTEL